MHPKQKDSLESMSPERKLQVALELYHSAWELKTAWLQQQHPFESLTVPREIEGVADPSPFGKGGLRGIFMGGSDRCTGHEHLRTHQDLGTEQLDLLFSCQPTDRIWRK
jgi:hypothetical protein